jgi:peptidyl-prolyl cis-trans isomerase C
MLQLRSTLTGAMAGFTAVLIAMGFVGCKKNDDEKAPTAETGDKTAPAPAVQTPADLSAPLATVDDVVITVGELQDQLNRQSPYVRARYTALEEKKNFLDSLVSFEVMAKEAQRRGLDKDPEVVRTMKQVMIQKLIKEEFAEKITPENIPDEELQAFYKKHESEYRRPAQVRAAAIVVKDKALAEQLSKQGKSEENKSPTGFRDMVLKHSIDEATKSSGGDLGYFEKDSTELPKPVIEAAFALENNKVSDPIAAGDGRFYVIKVTGTRKAMEKTFEDVKSQLVNRVYRDKRVESQKEFVEGLKQKAKIVVHEENLEKVKIEVSKEADMKPGEGHGNLPDLRNMPSPIAPRQ